MPTSTALYVVPQADADASLADTLACIDRIFESRPAEVIRIAGAALAQQHGEPGASPYLLGELHCKLAACRVVRHDPGAIRDYEAALAYAEQSGSAALKTDVLHGLARAFNAFGDSNSALQYCECALALGRTLGQERRLAQIMMTLGLVFATTQQFGRALEIYREAETMCAANQDKAGLARALNNWADTLVAYFEELSENGGSPDVGMLDQAIAHARQALLYASECDMTRTRLLATETLAHALEERGHYSMALSELENGLRTLSGCGFHKEELDIKARIGALLLRMGQVAASIDCMREAREFALRMGHYPHLADILKIHSGAHEAAGDFAAALQVYKEYHQMSQRARDQRAQLSAQILAARLDLEHARQEVQTHKSRVNQLEDSNRCLQVQVHEDSLTGLANRRALELHMQQYLNGDAGELTFVMADVDFFKQVNDRFSHLTGDEVLRIVGGLIRSCMRCGDVAARIGGEEFALVFDNIRTQEAGEACERLRRSVENYDWDSVAPRLSLTLSFGMTHLRQGDDLKALMTRADAALYCAKRNGRNRCERA